MVLRGLTIASAAALLIAAAIVAGGGQTGDEGERAATASVRGSPAQALPRVRVTQFLCVRRYQVVLWRFS